MLTVLIRVPAKAGSTVASTANVTMPSRGRLTIMLMSVAPAPVLQLAPPVPPQVQLTPCKAVGMVLSYLTYHLSDLPNLSTSTGFD